MGSDVSLHGLLWPVRQNVLGKYSKCTDVDHPSHSHSLIKALFSFYSFFCLLSFCKETVKALIRLWRYACLLVLYYMPEPLSCWTRIDPAFANSVDPDQLASEKANWSGSALFAIQYMNLCQQSGSSYLTGWKLEVGVASNTPFICISLPLGANIPLGVNLSCERICP